MRGRCRRAGSASPWPPRRARTPSWCPAGTRDQARTVAASLGVASSFQLVREPGEPRRLDLFGASAPAQKHAPVLAAAGVARPERFFQELRSAGWDVRQTVTFPDHHRYSRADAASLAAAARAAGARAIITTEKDLIRLLPFRPMPLPVLWLPLTVRIDPAPEFRAWLAGRLAGGAVAGSRSAGMKALRHSIEYALVVLTMRITRLLPWRAVRAMGSGLGFLFYAFDRRHRRTAMQNLAAAFPRKPEAERRAMLRQVFGHFGRLLFELLKFSGLTRDEVLARVEIEGGDRIRDARAKGRGALLFTGHFGYWEINAIAHAAAFAPIGVLARPLDNRRLHELLERMRGCLGKLRDLPAGRAPKGAQGPGAATTAWPS